jgi:hypothetical protein
MLAAGFERDRLPTTLPAGAELARWWHDQEGTIRPLLRETATFSWLNRG